MLTKILFNILKNKTPEYVCDTGINYKVDLYNFEYPSDNCVYISRDYSDTEEAFKLYDPLKTPSWISEPKDYSSKESDYKPYYRMSFGGFAYAINLTTEELKEVDKLYSEVILNHQKEQIEKLKIWSEQNNEK